MFKFAGNLYRGNDYINLILPEKVIFLSLAIHLIRASYGNLFRFLNTVFHWTICADMCNKLHTRLMEWVGVKAEQDQNEKKEPRPSMHGASSGHCTDTLIRGQPICLLLPSPSFSFLVKSANCTLSSVRG